jgi:hypothetical protein
MGLKWSLTGIRSPPGWVQPEVVVFSHRDLVRLTVATQFEKTPKDCHSEARVARRICYFAAGGKQIPRR